MKNLEYFLKNQVDQHQTPSIQYVFFDTQSILYSLCHGSKNVKTESPVTTATTYHLYSITKTFTALCVLQLAQAGKVGLSDPANIYLSSFPYPDKITVQQLLSHTSGIPNPIPLRWIHLPEEHAGFSRDQFFADIFKAHPKLSFEPGTQFKYSNLGYVLLGQLVEQVSGNLFEDFVHEHIVQRCGVENRELSFEMDSINHATGYQKWWSLSNAIFGLLIDKKKFMAEREGRWKPFRLFYNNGIAYGGMFGSSSGLIRYAQTLLQSNSVLLDDKHKEILFTESNVQNRPTGMSLSWFTGSLKGNRYFAHAGGGGGYYVELRVYPEIRRGSVIMYNRSGMKDEKVLNRTDEFFVTEIPRTSNLLGKG